MFDLVSGKEGPDLGNWNLLFTGLAGLGVTLAQKESLKCCPVKPFGVLDQLHLC